jgi:hypothetical protein
MEVQRFRLPPSDLPPGRVGASAQSEKRQDGEDDHDETDEIDDVVHGVPFHLGARLASNAADRAP